MLQNEELGKEVLSLTRDEVEPTWTIYIAT
jgi:hypothetical protein